MLRSEEATRLLCWPVTGTRNRHNPYSTRTTKCLKFIGSGVEWVEKTPCGDAGGWTAGRDHDPGRSDETGERLGRARVKSLTILRSKMRDVSTAVDMTKKAGRRSNFFV